MVFPKSYIDVTLPQSYFIEKRYELRGVFEKASVSITYDKMVDCWFYTAKMMVPDRLTREPIEVRITNRWPGPDKPTDEEHYVFGLVRNLVNHELEESFFVNGQLFADPHAKERQ